VLVDFDGTIATTDTTDLLLEQFAEPGWLAIEEDWMAGRIGSRECMLRQIDLVRATPREMDAFVSSIEIDPGFHAFVALCRDHGHDVQVVSDGLDRTVRAVLRRQGLDLPFAANHLEWVGEDRWRLAFPHARGDCRGLAGNCKCQFAVAPPGMVRVVVGDGRSDFCVAEAADLVLAKASLRKHCQDTGRPHFAFETFAEATTLYGAWLKENQNEAPDGADELRDE
jgi:2-hydroxy-3-keto-5-methylthiopentenyl-1-phosphate phosphatase